MFRSIEYEFPQFETELKNPIQELLQEDEKILFCCRVEYHMIWAQVITNRQVVIVKAYYLKHPIFFSKGKIETPLVKSILLEDITSIEPGFDSESDMQVVNIHGRDGNSVIACFTNPRLAKKYHDMLQNVLEGGKWQPTASSADRLRELSKLRVEGLISEEEFQSKRKEILREL